MTRGQQNTVRALLFAVSAAFILIGWCREEIQTVFIKAVNICLECIGIG